MSFTLEAGELCGYIGPNGAGKSTTIEIDAIIERLYQGEAERARTAHGA